jgi:hypothetical protein
VVVEEAPPRGDLYELDRTTWHHVVDTRSGEVVMMFRGELQASLSRDTGLWDNYTCSCASSVVISPDGESVIVTGCDGREEILPLPR